MKSLLLAPALVSLVQPDIVVESVETEVPIPLVAVAVDPPLVELAPDPGVVPIAVVQDEDARVQTLRQDLEGIAANLMAAQRAVETMAEQRDQARGEVGALAVALTVNKVANVDGTVLVDFRVATGINRLIAA